MNAGEKPDIEQQNYSWVKKLFIITIKIGQIDRAYWQKLHIECGIKSDGHYNNDTSGQTYCLVSPSLGL